MRKYIVTGGAGFIGSTLVDYLINDGHEVVVIDNLSSGKKENINPKARFVNIDLAITKYDVRNHDSPSVLVKEFEGAKAVFHLAALARVQPSIENPLEFNKANVDGTLNVLLAAKEAGVKRVVYSASSSAYGDVTIFPTPETHPLNPLSPYGLQKLIGEQYCKVFSICYGIETVCLRYFNVFGERQALEGAYCLVMGIFAQQLLNGEAMTITGTGEQRRDFTYVGDVLKANILASESSKVGNGEVINIGSGDNISINELADLLGGDRAYVPARLESQQTLADNTKAQELLGWKPTMSIEEWIPRYKKELGL